MLKITVLLFLIKIISISANCIEKKTLLTCEWDDYSKSKHGVININCTSGFKIQIVSAFYGRTAIFDCSGYCGICNTSCQHNATSVFSSVGRRHCFLKSTLSRLITEKSTLKSTFLK